MKVVVQGHHVDVSEALREYTEEKVNRFTKFFQNISKVDIFFEGEKNGEYRAKVVVGLPKHKTVVCAEKGKTLYAALDLAADAAERSLNAFKEKLRRRDDRERVTRRLTRES